MASGVNKAQISLLDEIIVDKCSNSGMVRPGEGEMRSLKQNRRSVKKQDHAAENAAEKGN